MHASKHASELLAECGVAERIEERVQRGVEIADPRNGGHELRVDPVGAYGDHCETHEVRQEADMIYTPGYATLLVSPFHCRFWNDIHSRFTIMTLVLLVVLLLRHSPGVYQYVILTNSRYVCSVIFLM